MNLAKYSLDNTKIVYFFLAVLLIGGVFSFGRLVLCEKSAIFATDNYFIKRLKQI